MDELYKWVKSIIDGLKNPDVGIHLVKAIGNINPVDMNKHMDDSKILYDKKDENGISSGTTVQCIKTSKKGKDGKKEPVQYIKAVVGGIKKPGEEPISYYRNKDGVDIRDILDQIIKNGKPDGKDGVNYNKVKGDEIPEVQKLFAGNENMPRTYYYTTIVRGDGTDKDGKPYDDSKVHSVTILSDHNNKTNKNFKVKDVFRKAEEANEKNEKINQNIIKQK